MSYSGWLFVFTFGRVCDGVTLQPLTLIAAELSSCVRRVLGRVWFPFPLLCHVFVLDY